jgi:hypothetical protein
LDRLADNSRLNTVEINGKNNKGPDFIELRRYPTEEYRNTVMLTDSKQKNRRQTTK